MQRVACVQYVHSLYDYPFGLILFDLAGSHRSISYGARRQPRSWLLSAC